MTWENWLETSSLAAHDQKSLRTERSRKALESFSTSLSPQTLLRPERENLETLPETRKGKPEYLWVVGWTDDTGTDKSLWRG